MPGYQMPVTDTKLVKCLGSGLIGLWRGFITGVAGVAKTDFYIWF